MSLDEQLNMLKIMYGENDTGLSQKQFEDLLLVYLRLAEQIVLNRMYPSGTNRDENVHVPQKYATTQVEIAHFLLLKRGAEGQTSHNENGINRSYESGDVPPSLLSRILPVCGVLRK